MSILPLYLQYILFFFLYLLHTTENDFLTVSFKTSIDVKRERHLPDKNAICCVRSSKVLPASQATHVQIMDLKNKIQKEKRLKLCCLNCSGSFQQTCSYGSREARALSPHLTRHRHRAPGSADSQGWGMRMRSSHAESLLHQARCHELEEPIDALFHPEAFKPLSHTSGSVNGNRQFGTRTFFCSS